VIALLITAFGLYVVWPSLVRLWSSLPQLSDIEPWWFAVLFVLEAGSFTCAWALQRITLREKGWSVVATAQLAGNAFSRVIPGGAAAGGALQARILLGAGLDGSRVASGLTAASVLSTATLAALPVLALPAILGGAPVAHDLRTAIFLGFGLFVVLAVAGTLLLTRDGPLRFVGRVVQMVGNRLRKRASTDLPDRLIAERNRLRAILGERWRGALVATAGNWLLDFLALLAALAAVGTRPRPSLVLVAYVVAAVLGMIPITPGGLGFVEAGLTATLVLAGVSGPDATLATLAYRLVSFWLPIPVGLVAYAIFRVRSAARAPA
jgi:uncharacterized protein (TIRG00374 family)